MLITGARKPRCCTLKQTKARAAGLLVFSRFRLGTFWTMLLDRELASSGFGGGVGLGHPFLGGGQRIH